MTYVEAVIVGAGPAGLAAAACLHRVGVPHVILEREACVGASWHQHYERLHLHSDRTRSSLPYFPLPEEYPRYPSRAQFVAYLESYARHFGLRPRFGQEVYSAHFREGRWHVLTQHAGYESRYLILATGYNARPYVPAWPGRETFTGEVMHSSAYKHGAPYRGKQVLVVGFGNSGGELAIDLWEHGARPSLSVRGPVNVVPREVLGVPILAISILLEKLPTPVADALATPIVRLALGNLARLGLPKSPQGPFAQLKRRGRVPLLDVGTIRLIREGAIEVRPGVARFEGDDVIFADGTRQGYEAVVLATGYRPTVDSLLQGTYRLADEHGNVRQSGKEVARGLYLCGFYVSPTGMLREIAIEAKRIAQGIARTRARG